MTGPAGGEIPPACSLPSVRRGRRLAVVALALCLALLAAPFPARATDGESRGGEYLNDLFQQERPPEVPDDATLEAAGAVVGEIEIQVYDVFDTDNPKENNKLFRFANKLHISTRDGVIRRELLFKPGEPYEGRLLAESERLLRSSRLFYDARIFPVRHADGRVDIRVVTRDVWTLVAGVSFGRGGGENAFGVGLSDTNFLGFGKAVTLEHSSDVDRSSNLVGYRDPNLGGTRLSMQVAYQDNSDGFLRRFDLGKPFYSLDTRFAAGGKFFDFDRVDPLYDLGEAFYKFRHVEDVFELRAGFSNGLVGGMAQRWSAGLTYDAHRFYEVPEYSDPLLLPDDRKLVYPWVEYSLVQAAYAKLRNVDSIHRTEDLNFGVELRLRLGWSDEAFGADRDQAILSVSAVGGFDLGRRQLLIGRLHAGGRRGSDGGENVLAGGALRYLRPTFGMHQLHTALSWDVAYNLDGENQLLLGGDSGLRGYPLRYQAGDRRYLFNLEHRFYTGWHVLRLARVGAAIFFDAGEAWYTGPRGDRAELGLLTDVGCGLRFESTRSSGRSMLHVDVAFPLGGDDSIDSVQFLVKAKERF